MTHFESSVKTIPHPAGVVFDFLSDFNHFGHLIPHDRISDWSCTIESCRFHVKGIGDMGLKILEKVPVQAIKYASEGKTPFNFFLLVQLESTSSDACQLRLSIEAHLNPMLKMVVAEKVKKFLELLSAAIANYPYPAQ